MLNGVAGSPASLELALYSAEAEASLQNALAEPVGLDHIRAHHWPYVQELMRSLVTDPLASLEDAAATVASQVTNSVCDSFQEDRTATTAKARAWRRDYDLDPYDNSLPVGLGQDYLGVGDDADPVRFRNRLAQEFLAILMLPPETRITIGRDPDGICEAPVCGYHCLKSNINASFEDYYTTQFSFILDDHFEFMANSPNAAVDVADVPGYYDVSRTPVAYNPPARPRIRREGGARGKGYVREGFSELELCLGVFRDTIAANASMYRYMTFDNLQQARQAVVDALTA